MIVGSHVGIGKSGAVYFNSPCLPIQCQSLLQNIFLFVLFNSLNGKVYNNKIVFQNILVEVSYLTNSGITINHST